MDINIPLRRPIVDGIDIDVQYVIRIYIYASIMTLEYYSGSSNLFRKASEGVIVCCGFAIFNVFLHIFVNFKFKFDGNKIR